MIASANTEKMQNIFWRGSPSVFGGRGLRQDFRRTRHRENQHTPGGRYLRSPKPEPAGGVAKNRRRTASPSFARRGRLLRRLMSGERASNQTGFDTLRSLGNELNTPKQPSIWLIGGWQPTGKRLRGGSRATLTLPRCPYPWSSLWVCPTPISTFTVGMAAFGE